ncbi:FAD-dependent oxidoreductase [Asticcacaulis sp. 201]|uniref:FAD-dependent oxidoreductase n=1 Tax=Asticcacaulis sp. 201 TaxID=3028787 RepID=UPI0029169750|nr:FAD-dependent oxidoreductase [Asticcacaulis sp. 201]MDV6333246.1 NAD(P)-binding protein [Asticcacaulis sp. 201]
MKPTRRQLLYGSGSAAIGMAAISPFVWDAIKPKKPIPGGIVGANSARGHRLRDGAFPAPVDSGKHDVIIVGSGIAGLSAAYNLDKTGIRDIRVLELEDHAGGNAHSGKNNVSAYPWGAHYVPLLSSESGHIKALFRDFGIITGEDNGLPVYNEDYILNDPDERLFLEGRWQEGLLPTIGVSTDDQAQYKRFLTHMDSFKVKRGGDDRRWFAIPIDESSADADARALDRLTMKDWMLTAGYTSEPLHGFVNYGCRDDFGVRHDEISAYAGIHYFAGRDGKAANTKPDSVITWPEGNGFLAHKLAEPMAGRILPNALVYNINDTGAGVVVDYWDGQISRRLTARAVVVATPRFIAGRLVPRLRSADFTYAPWVVANLTLNRLPGGVGADVAWDNVIKDSPALGYVVATHQVPQMQPLRTVITYYWPLTHVAPAEARKEAIARTYDDWQILFLSELYRVHPELVGQVAHMDVWLWGHAMIRPVPGFIWGQARRDALKQAPPIFTAHSDMSGISIFEEAYTHGLKASEAVKAFLT